MNDLYKCYVISLARQPEKRSDFLDRNRQTGLQFEVFEAIDGNDLTFERCVQKGLIAANAVFYTPGAIGCGASHFSLWKEAQSTQRNLLIFEDDAYCRHDIADRLKEILPLMPDWDIVLLGFNTNAVLDFRISRSCNLEGFFSNRNLSHEQLHEFTHETGAVVAARLNNAFGLCSYLVSPKGAEKLISLFPMDNRPVFIPGNKASFGRGTFRCIIIDMLTNTLYRRINAYVTIPPLVLPRHDHLTSTTHGPGSDLGQQKPRRSPSINHSLFSRLRMAGRKLCDFTRRRI
jgi:glycosyl transferase, family 25